MKYAPVKYAPLSFRPGETKEKTWFHWIKISREDRGQKAKLNGEMFSCSE